MKLVYWISFVLVVVGALNWGLIGLFDFNLVTFLLGAGAAATVVYDLVGLAAIFMIIKKIMKHNRPAPQM